MNPQSTGPDILSVLTSILTPILSFVACLIGSFVAIRSDNRQQVWRQREVQLHWVRWSLEQRNSTDSWTQATGQATLDALIESKLLQKDDRDFVRRIANKLPTDDRSQPPYAESADLDDAARDSQTEARQGDLS